MQFMSKTVHQLSAHDCQVVDKELIGGQFENFKKVDLWLQMFFFSNVAIPFGVDLKFICREAVMLFFICILHLGICCIL